MKKLVIAGLISLAILLSGHSFVATARAYVSVNGYYRSNGTYVRPYVRSSPNALKYDNYGYKGGSLYNDSYYRPTKSYSPSWYAPSYNTDSSYYSGKSLYNSKSYSLPSYTYKSPYSSRFGW